MIFVRSKPARPIAHTIWSDDGSERRRNVTLRAFLEQSGQREMVIANARNTPRDELEQLEERLAANRKAGLVVLPTPIESVLAKYSNLTPRERRIVATCLARRRVRYVEEAYAVSPHAIPLKHEHRAALIEALENARAQSTR